MGNFRSMCLHVCEQHLSKSIAQEYKMRVGRRRSCYMCATYDVCMNMNEQQLLQGFLVAMVTEPQCHPIYNTLEGLNC